MTLDQPHRARASPAALVAAITCGAVAVAVPVAGPAGAAPPPCGALGKLFEYELNDRCEFVDPDPKVEVALMVAGLSQAGLFATTVECADGSLVPVIARPDELLITAPTRGLLNEAIGQVRERLQGAFVESRPINGLAAVVSVTPGTIDAEFLARRIAGLQGATWSTDLNYLEPAMPNNSFHPAGNPSGVPGPEPDGSGGEGRVLVLDSPPEAGRDRAEPDVVLSGGAPPAVYDVDGNGKVDEDHGHGVFVASLIKRLAPDAEVTLYGVNGGQVPGSGRWSPMLFSDADLITSMGTAFGLSPTGTAVRRTFDVVNLSLGGAGCAGVADRLALGRFMRDLARVAALRGSAPRFVAAAGNDGADIKHFPAAFRDRRTMEAAADAIDAASGTSPSPAGNAVRLLHAQLARRVLAVGSWTDRARDGFSNCGRWVNAYAPGADTMSRYPSESGLAIWSGTSFATPQVAATLVGGSTSDVAIAEGIGACPVSGP